MNCTNCDAPLEPDAKFCGECGQPVTPASSRPSSNLKCTHCGADLDPSFQFCGECGHPVSQESLPEPAAIELPVAEPPPSPVAVPEPMSPPPAEEPPPPPPQMKPPPSPSAVPTVMASQVKSPPPPVQRPPVVPPAAQPVAAPAPQAPPKKKRTGCVIAIIAVVALFICCVAGGLLGWYILDNASFDFSSSGIDLPILEQLLERNQDIPFLDWILGDKTAITFANSTGQEICMIYIAPTNAIELSEEVLGEDGFLYSGDTFTAYIESWQSVDILVLDCSGNTLYENYNIYLSGEDVLITLSPP
jgi:hypothetical protein